MQEPRTAAERIGFGDGYAGRALDTEAYAGEPFELYDYLDGYERGEATRLFRADRLIEQQVA